MNINELVKIAAYTPNKDIYMLKPNANEQYWQTVNELERMSSSYTVNGVKFTSFVVALYFAAEAGATSVMGSMGPVYTLSS